MTTEQLYKPDIEEAVLASFMIDNDTFYGCNCNAELFSGKRVFVFNAINKLLKEGIEADIITIHNEVSGDVDAVFLSKVMDMPISQDLRYHIQKLEEVQLRRQIYMAYGKGVELCKAGANPDDILRDTSNAIISVDTNEAKKIKDTVQDVEDEISLIASGGKEPGLPSGIHVLDSVTGGFDAELILIAARPGVGKTSLALNICRNLAFCGVPSMIFSLEMTANQLTKRMIADVGSIDGKYLFRGEVRKLEGERQGKFFKHLGNTSSKISELPITIDDSTNLTIDRIFNRAKKEMMRNKLGAIVVDHLGLIAGWNNEGQGPKAEISRGLKMMSKELNIPVFALSQMNRNIENRQVKKPALSDLRDSGTLEQDADMVLFPDVPDKENQTELAGFNEACIFVAKNRKGRIGLIEDLKWQGHYFRFSENNGI